MGREAPKPSEELTLAKDSIYAVLNKPKTLEAIKAALPELGVNPQRIATVAFSVIAGKPALLKCDAKSLIKVIIEGTLLGLSFDPHLKQAAIVPFGNQATLIVEYMGLVKLARNSGVLSTVRAEVVYENDEFDYELGLEPDLFHKPPKKGGRGKPIGVYAVGKLTSGEPEFKYLEQSEVEFYKGKSRAKDAPDSPWNTDPMAMWRKTAIRRLVGYLPMDDKTARAVQNDEMLETGHEQSLAPEFFSDDAIEVEAIEAKPTKTEAMKDALKKGKGEKASAAGAPAATTSAPPAELTEEDQIWTEMSQALDKLRPADADIEVSAATGGKFQSRESLNKAPVDVLKQVFRHLLATDGDDEVDGEA